MTDNEYADRMAREAERVYEFMRTHVGRYELPGKLAKAQNKNAATVNVPASDMVRLLARVGQHIAPVIPEAKTPNIPAALDALPSELSAMFEWDADGEAILSRAQIEALIGQVARIAYGTPRAVVRKKPAVSVAEKVSAAIIAGKKSVAVGTDELAAMLATVDAERATAVEKRAA